MAMGPGAWLSLILFLVGWSEAQEGAGGARPRPPPPPPPKPQPPPEPVPPEPPDWFACFRVEFGGKTYEWTRAELEQKVKGTGLDSPVLRRALDALRIGESISRLGGKLTRIECTTLDVEPGPAPVPPEPRPGAAPLWPLPGVSSKGKPTSLGSFGAPRKQGTKFHAGVDLGAPEGTVVVAPEDGTLVRDQGWDGLNAKALLLETARPGGPVLLFGGVAPGSWPVNEKGRLDKRFVRRGEPIAVIGRYPNGGTMLHFETYVRGTRQNRKWFQMRPKPGSLIDPTPYVGAMVPT